MEAERGASTWVCTACTYENDELDGECGRCAVCATPRRKRRRQHRHDSADDESARAMDYTSTHTGSGAGAASEGAGAALACTRGTGRAHRRPMAVVVIDDDDDDDDDDDQETSRHCMSGGRASGERYRQSRGRNNSGKVPSLASVVDATSPLTSPQSTHSRRGLSDASAGPSALAPTFTIEIIDADGTDEDDDDDDECIIVESQSQTFADEFSDECEPHDGSAAAPLVVKSDENAARQLQRQLTRELNQHTQSLAQIRAEQRRHLRAASDAHATDEGSAAKSAMETKHSDEDLVRRPHDEDLAAAASPRGGKRPALDATASDAELARVLHETEVAEAARSSSFGRTSTIDGLCMSTSDSSAFASRLDGDADLARRLQEAESTSVRAAVRSDALLESDAEVARALQENENQALVAARSAAESANDALLAQLMQEEEEQEAADLAEMRRLEIEADSSDLYDVLATHRKDIVKILRKQARILPNMRFIENEHSRPGTPLYNRFVTAWERVADQTVLLAFHGTAEQNIDSICHTGLDPSLRRGQALGPGEYFAKNAAVSLPYCKGGRKMIVFALIMDRSGLTAEQQQVVVINKPEHQLPLFVVTF